MEAALYIILVLICCWQAAKGFHVMLGFGTGPHRWRYSHTSQESFVGVDTRTNEWVGHRRGVKHYTCAARHCDAHKTV